MSGNMPPTEQNVSQLEHLPRRQEAADTAQFLDVRSHPGETEARVCQGRHRLRMDQAAIETGKTEPGTNGEGFQERGRGLQARPSGGRQLG